jgi:hypothetical protein
MRCVVPLDWSEGNERNLTFMTGFGIVVREIKFLFSICIGKIIFSVAKRHSTMMMISMRVTDSTCDTTIQHSSGIYATILLVHAEITYYLLVMTL